MKNLKPHYFYNQQNLFMRNSETHSEDMGRSAFSASVRKQILWNVLEPGDPYDIRKSMIAKFPNDHHNFMGDNLQIICLFQSAEIERLTEFLDDYKFRYREIERRQLDRHSYEIQIKQLTHQLASESGYKAENQKLKDFIKKQSIEYQELKGVGHFSGDILQKYQATIKDLERLTLQRNQAKIQLENSRIEINDLQTRIKVVEMTKNQEIQSLRLQQGRSQHQQHEMKVMKERYEGQINNLQFELTRLRQFNESKNFEITELMNKNSYLLREIETIKTQNYNENVENNRNLQERVALLSQQIQRLNLILKQSTSKIDEVSRNELIWQQKYYGKENQLQHIREQIINLQNSYSQLQIKYQQQALSVPSKEVNTVQLEQQINYYKKELSSQQIKYDTLFHNFQELQYQYNKTSIREKQYNQIVIELKNYENTKHKLIQYENKIALLSQEIQRLTASLEAERRNRIAGDELEDLRRRSLENEKRLTEKYEAEIQRRVFEYERKLSERTKETNIELESRMQAINLEVQRLNTYLREKTQESEVHKRRIRQLQNSIHQKYDIQYSRKVGAYEKSIQELQWKTDQLMRKLKMSEAEVMRIPELQNKIGIWGQDIQRLNIALRNKDQQCENMRRQYTELQYTVRNTYEVETSRNMSMLEEQKNALFQQNQELRKKLQELVELHRKLSEFENRNHINVQEIERLNGALRNKVDALNQAEDTIRKMNMQLQKMSRNRVEIQQSFVQRSEMEKMEVSRRVSNFQQNISHLQMENEELRRLLNESNRQYSSKFNQTQSKITISNQQIQRLNNSLRQKNNDYNQAEVTIRNQNTEIQNLRRQIREMQTSITQKYEIQTSRKITSYEHTLSNASREVEDLRRKNQQLDNLNRKNMNELNQYEHNYKAVVQELQLLKRQTNQKHNETVRTITTYEQNIGTYTREMQKMQFMLKQYENKMNNLSQENEKLRSQLKQIGQESQMMRRNIVEITQKYEVETNKNFSSFEQSMNNVNREREDLMRKISELENIRNNQTRQIEEYRRKVADLEHRLVSFEKQFENMRVNFGNKSQQDMKQWQNRSAHYQQEIESWRNRYRELQMTVTQKYQVQASRKITNYQQNLQNLNRQYQASLQKIKQLQRIRVNQQQEITKLGNFNKRLTEQNQHLKNRIRELEANIKQKYQVEVSRKYSSYEQNIQILNTQIEENKRIIINYQKNIQILNQGNEDLTHKLQDLQRKNIELQQRNKMMMEEIQRLNFVLKGKQEEWMTSDGNNKKLYQELELLRRQMKENEINITKKYEIETNQKSTMYEQNMNNIKRQNEDLKRKIMQYENKMKLMTQQIERLNQNFKIKIDEYENKIRNYHNEIENYKRRLHETEISSTHKFETQISRKTTMFEQNIVTITREYENYKADSNRKMQEYENKVKMLTEEIQRLNLALRKKVDELNQIDNQYRSVREEYETTVRVFRENEKSASEWMSGEVGRITREYEEFRKQHNKKIAEYENKISLMTQQIQRLNQNLRQKVQEINNIERNIIAKLKEQNETLRRNVREMQTNYSQYTQKQETEVSRKITTYEQTLGAFRNQKQSYIKKIEQLSRISNEQEGKIKLMTQEIQRLNQVLKGQLGQIQHYKQMTMHLEHQSNKQKELERHYLTEIQKFKSQITILQRKLSESSSSLNMNSEEYMKLKKSYDVLFNQYESSKRHLTEYEGSVKKLYGEFERLQAIINELKIERQSLYEKNQGLSMEIDRLTHENKLQEEEIHEIRLRLTDQMALEKRINEQLSLMVVLFAEIETLRLRISDKDKQVKEIRRSSLAPLKVTNRFES